MCSVTMPLVDSHAAQYGVPSDFLFVFLLPALELLTRVFIGELLQLSFKRLLLLIAPSSYPRLNATRHRNAQVDANCDRNHEQDEK